MSPAEKAVRVAVATWRRLSEDADPDAVAPLLDAEAVLMAPGRPPVTGRSQCVASLSPASFGVQCRFNVVQVAVYGDWAHAWCEVARSIPAGAGDPEIRVEGHTLTLLKCNEAGLWLVAREATLLAPARP